MIWYEHLKHKPSQAIVKVSMVMELYLNYIFDEWYGDMTVKASDHCNRTSTVTIFLYHIFCSFYNLFITTLRVAAELYITILINQYPIEK